MNGTKRNAVKRAVISTRVRRRVIQEMQRRGLSQMAMAQLLGCTQQYISKKLSGRDGWMQPTIERFARALNLESEWLTSE